jgi:hypothetical protein
MANNCSTDELFFTILNSSRAHRFARSALIARRRTLLYGTATTIRRAASSSAR